jgi:hypothetical protein
MSWTLSCWAVRRLTIGGSMNFSELESCRVAGVESSVKRGLLAGLGSQNVNSLNTGS